MRPTLFLLTLSALLGCSNQPGRKPFYFDSRYGGFWVNEVFADNEVEIHDLKYGESNLTDNEVAKRVHAFLKNDLNEEELKSGYRIVTLAYFRYNDTWRVDFIVHNMQEGWIYGLSVLDSVSKVEVKNN